eukprot:1175596-Prorocentrum_minimum.AAC.2
MYARRTEGRLGRTSPTRACSDARARHGHCKMDHYDLIKPHAITREDSTLPPILYGRHICLCRALSDALCARIRRQSLCTYVRDVWPRVGGAMVHILGRRVHQAGAGEAVARDAGTATVQQGGGGQRACQGGGCVCQGQRQAQPLREEEQMKSTESVAGEPTATLT